MARFERRLFTLIHISDIHIGRLDPDGGGGAIVDAAIKDWWRHHTVFCGFLGHSYDALVHFQDAFQRLQESEDARLVVTGDLTATGRQEEFVLAKKYIHKYVEVRGERIGLELEGEAILLPGNHDHWAGTARMWVGGSHLEDAFRTLPPKIASLKIGDYTLTLVSIDSDKDVVPKSISRIFARGCFVSQLEALEPRLSARRDNEIRVLLMHHSPMVESFSLGMTRRSRRALELFLAERDIPVILTGHTHTSAGNVLRIKNRVGESMEVLEARCGTTLQRDYLPLGWAQKAGKIRLERNTFLVHRLFEVKDERSVWIEWRTEVHERSPRGFARVSPLADRNNAELAPLVLCHRDRFN